VLNIRPRSLICSLLCCAVAGVALGAPAAPAGSWQAQADVSYGPELDTGFHLLYQLKPVEARAQFAVWQKAHPEDPLGSASEAASYLFEECYRQGILTSEFFLDKKRFLGKIAVKPDQELRAAFFAAVQRAQDLALLQLEANPYDANALFAMTLSVGFQADYASLIEKHQLEGLRMLRAADKFAKKLLVVAPDTADAYLTLGTANYIIGSLPAPKRFFLRFAGIRGDKRGGIKQLEIAAAHGRYLRPFAKILLALVALREKKTEVARTQLTELVAEFPQNPLFAHELAKLNASPAAALSHVNARKAELAPTRFAFPKSAPPNLYEKASILTRAKGPFGRITLRQHSQNILVDFDQLPESQRFNTVLVTRRRSYQRRLRTRIRIETLNAWNTDTTATSPLGRSHCGFRLGGSGR